MTKTIKYRATGSTRRVADFVSDRLVKRRIADYVESPGYLTRDMRAVEVPAVVIPEPARPDVANPDADPAPAGTPADGLASMGVDELRALAESRGIKVHHRAGKAKILAALRGE